MSSANNDLTQSLLAECRRKDELLDAYREKAELQENLLAIKDEKIQLYEKHIEDLKKILKGSMEQTDKVIEIANNIIQ
jgi:hypothetical protein